MENFKIRKAEFKDVESMLKIYEYYVKNTVITFEYYVPSVDEFRSRMEKVIKGYPYIVAEKDGEILGYAYTHCYIEKEAYNWTAETTIYLKPNSVKMGIGKKLYQKLEDISRAQNIMTHYACIGYPEVDDEYLTHNSVQFHEHLGFRRIGEFKNSGYKFDRWYHMVWMEKNISERKLHPEPFIPFPQLSESKLIELGLN